MDSITSMNKARSSRTWVLYIHEVSTLDVSYLSDLKYFRYMVYQLHKADRTHYCRVFIQFFNTVRGLKLIRAVSGGRVLGIRMSKDSNLDRRWCMSGEEGDYPWVEVGQYCPSSSSRSRTRIIDILPVSSSSESSSDSESE